MSEVEPQVPDGEGRSRRFGWWVWILVALALGGAGVGSYGGGGGFSPTSATASASKLPSSSAAGSGAKGGVPPTPTITSEPSNPTTATTATFKYSDTLPAVTFECSLDGSKYNGCGHLVSVPSAGSITYTSLHPDVLPHCFSVEAVLAVLTSTPANYCWTIDALPFIINGSLSSPLRPGTSQSVDLSIMNPNAQSITIPAQSPPTNNVSVVISLDTSSVTYVSASPSQKATWAGCDPSVNFALTQGLLLPITIPGGATVSLSDHTTEYTHGMPQADWPVVTMYDGGLGPTSHTKQDSCEKLPLHFAWSATGSGT